MLNQIYYQNEGGRILGRLAAAGSPSAGLFASVFGANRRLLLLGRLGKTGRFDRLVAAEAWDDAAFELLQLEAPEWRVRRLCQEDGEWLCSLSRFRELPDWLDEAVEGRHKTLAIAILSALLELRARPAGEHGNWARSSAAANGVADSADYR